MCGSNTRSERHRNHGIPMMHSLATEISPRSQFFAEHQIMSAWLGDEAARSWRKEMPGMLQEICDSELTMLRYVQLWDHDLDPAIYGKAHHLDQVSTKTTKGQKPVCNRFKRARVRLFGHSPRWVLHQNKTGDWEESLNFLRYSDWRSTPTKSPRCYNSQLPPGQQQLKFYGIPKAGHRVNGWLVLHWNQYVLMFLDFVCFLNNPDKRHWRTFAAARARIDYQRIWASHSSLVHSRSDKAWLVDQLQSNRKRPWTTTWRETGFLQVLLGCSTTICLVFRWCFLG